MDHGGRMGTPDCMDRVPAEDRWQYGGTTYKSITIDQNKNL